MPLNRVTATELIKDLERFFLLSNHLCESVRVNADMSEDKYYWVDGEHKIEILKTQYVHPIACCNYKISLFKEDQSIVLFQYNGLEKQVTIFRRGQWINRFFNFTDSKEIQILGELSVQPNFAHIDF